MQLCDGLLVPCVKQPIRFIQHKKLHILQLHLSGLDQLKHPTWRPNLKQQ
jgi:hypothetical protein